MTRKLTVRVRGQIYDLKTLRALSSFEVSAPETVTLPKKASMCNDMCVVEKAGEVSRELARELGAVLSQKLHIVIEDSAYSGEHYWLCIRWCCCRRWCFGERLHT